VWDVTIGDARAYAAWYSSASGRAIRLPTELEWEHAARGWTTFEYPYGEHFDPSKANTIESRIGRTVPVQAYEAYASPFGIVGMAGNVEEWTSSAYRPYPGGHVVADDFFNAHGLGYPVVRGGSFALGGALPYPTR
jgi:toxoflavin biosynthesis protein ToxD